MSAASVTRRQQLDTIKRNRRSIPQVLQLALMGILCLSQTISEIVSVSSTIFLVSARYNGSTCGKVLIAATLFIPIPSWLGQERTLRNQEVNRKFCGRRG